MGIESGPRLLLDRNFGPFFFGSLISYCGTWFQNIAQALLVYRLTGSIFLVGVVNFAQFAAILLFSPIAGVAADRFDRTKLIVVTHLAGVVSAGFMSILVWLDRASTPSAIAVAFAAGCTTAVSLPAMQAMVPSLVRREDVRSAVALDSMTFNLSRALGPVLAVLIISRLGMAAAFLLNAFSYLVMIAGVKMVHPRGFVGSTIGSFGETLSLLASRIVLFTMICVGALISIAIDPINTLTPAFATEVFGRPDTFAGYLIGAFGAGTVIGAILLTTIWEVSYTRMVGTLLWFFAMMMAFAVSDSSKTALMFLFLAGIGFLLSQSSATIILQTSVDDGQRGRVMGLWAFSYLGVRPFGALADGAIASAIGPSSATMLMALPAVIAAGLVRRLVKRERRTNSS